MPTQEEINAANVELQIANDNYAALADRYNQYKNVFQSYANASPETQARAEGAMQDALASYEKLKLDMYAAEDRIQQAQNRVNNLNAEVQAAQAMQTRRYGRGRNYTLETTIEPSPEVETITYVPSQNINIPDWSQYQQPTVSETWRAQTTYQPNQSMVQINTRQPFGGITQGKGTTAGEYLGNVWDGLTTTYGDPQEFVYQSNSRLPGRNVGANIGRAGTYFTTLFGGGALRGRAPTPTIPRYVDTTKYGAVRNQAVNFPRYVDTTNARYGASRLVNQNRVVPTLIGF